MASKSPNEIPRENKDMKEGNTEGRWDGTRNSQTFCSFTADACDVLVRRSFWNTETCID